MIHRIEIGDNTETSKLVLEFLNGMGNSEVNPIFRDVLLSSLKESKQGNLKLNHEVFSDIEQSLHSK